MKLKITDSKCNVRRGYPRLIISDGTEGDWRVGLSVKVKYRTHELYYEPPYKVIDVFPSGHGGIVDKDGVLKLETPSGRVFLAPADEWRTA